MQNRIFAERLNDSRRELIHVRTVPRIIPTNAECVSSDAGTGDNTATGRPRFVTVTASPSRFISLITSAINRRRTDSSSTRTSSSVGTAASTRPVPASQPIESAATSAPRSQVASLAERDEPGHRLAFRELKQLGRGPVTRVS